MKTKVRRLSKRILAVLLGVVMLVTSIGITAYAYYYDGGTYYMQGSFNSWGALSGTNNSGNKRQHYYYIYTNGSSSDYDITFKFKEADGSGNESWFGAGDTDSISTTGKQIYENGGENIHLNRKNLGTTDTTWYKVKVWFEHSGSCYCWYNIDTTKTELIPTITTKKGSATTTTFTAGDTVSLSASSTNNFGTVSYSYEYKKSTDSNYTSISGTSLDTTGFAAGNYTIRVTANDGAVVSGTNSESARTATATKTITVNPQTYDITFAQPENGSISVDASTTSPVAVVKGNTATVVVTPNSGYRIKSLTDNGTAVSEAARSTAAYSYTISNVTSPHDIIATMELNNTSLSAPTNVKLNNTAGNLAVDAKRGEKVTLSWTGVANAGSYTILKDRAEVATGITTTSYQIEKGSSYSGAYSVVAVPSDTAAYSDSAASTACTLTVNKVQLAAPTVKMSASEIDTTKTVTFTITDTNTTYTSGTDYKYYRTDVGTSAFSTQVSGLSYTTGTFSSAGNKTFKFKAISQQSDYYTDSAETSQTFHVSKYTYCLTGDMVTGQGGADGWPTAITTYPVNTFVSKNIFYRSVTVSGGGANDKHYFRLTDQSNQYTVTKGTDTDMSTHDSSSSAVTASKKTTNGAMYVTGNGTFKIYVDQTTSGSPKVWVESNEYSLTASAYYATFNLDTDAHNTPQAGDTGGTVKFSVTETGAATASAEITKTQNAVMIATPADGYYFAGWYSSTDFADGNKVSELSTYSFIPTANGDYYALFKKNIPVHYNLSVAANIAHATVTATYNGTTIQEGGATLSVPVGATVRYSISLDTGCQIDSTNPSGLTVGSNKSFVMPASNTVVSVSASKTNFALNGVVSPNYGTIAFYSDQACTKGITTAQYQDDFYAKYTPPSDLYVLNSTTPFSKSGTGLSNPTSIGTNIVRYRMGYSVATITANVVAATPTFGSNPNKEYIINEGTFTYSPNVSKYTSVSFTLKKGNTTKAYTSAVTEPSNPQVTYNMASIGGVGVYTLTITARNEPTGISNAKTATTTVTITIKHNEFSVTYYLDLHDTELDESKTHKVYPVDDYYDDEHISEASILKDENNNDIFQEFTHVTGSEHIYQATLATPCDDSGANTPTDLYAMIEANGKKTIVTIAVAKLDAQKKSGEIWVEFAQGSKVSLTRKTATNPTKIPSAANKQRIYLKRPASLGNDWARIHVYYWRNVNGTETTYTTWNAAPEMTEIGADSSGNKYYYCDIHSKANMIIFQGRDTSDSIKEQTDDLALNGNYWYAELEDSTPEFDTMSSNAVIPAAATYNNVITMSTNETAASLYKGGITADKIVYESEDETVCTVSNTGKLTPGSVTGSTTVTTTIYGTVGNPDLIKDFTNQEKITLRTTINVINPNDPDRWSYKIMSYGSDTTTITTNNGGRLTGMISRDLTLCDSAGATPKTYSDAGILTTETDNATGIITYTLRYASPEPTAYSTISLSASVTSIPIEGDEGQRYGFIRWEKDGVEDSSIAASTVYSTELSGRITTSKNIPADGSSYVAIYQQYYYTDITITYNYLEYKTDQGEDGKNYFYDASKFKLLSDENGSIYESYKNGTELNEAGYCESLHTPNSYTVTVEVQGIKEATTNDSDINNAIRKNLKNITNKYYDYSYDSHSSFSSNPVYPDKTNHPYNMSVGVNLSRKVKTYKVNVTKLNGEVEPYTQDENGDPIYYQSYVSLQSSNKNKVKWVQDDAELNIGKRFRFRVSGNMDIEEKKLEDQSKQKERESSITHTNHEIRDEEITKTVNNVSVTTNAEMLTQNFYIADFFNTKMYRYTLDDNSDYIPDEEGTKSNANPYDSIQFVGGGIFYFSVDSSDTELRVPAVKQYLDDKNEPNPEAIENVITDKILANRVEGEDDLKPYYGTEIAPQLIRDGNDSTGLIFKYTPYEVYNSSTHQYSKNTDVFRYSNELKAYQYVYGAEMENKSKNSDKYMRMYSYYIFSYTNYDSNGDEYTAYKMVISKNHGFAPTYVDSTPTN